MPDFTYLRISKDVAKINKKTDFCFSIQFLL